jgi:type II secretory pathway pseudopilin PulG
LVVVSIIALLIAILLPSLNKAREAGRSVVCMNQLKQTSLMATIYISDSKEPRKNNLTNFPLPIAALPMDTAWTLPSLNGFGGSIRRCPSWTNGCVDCGPRRKPMHWAAAV